MPLTPKMKSDVRRHLGYPVAGLARVSPFGVGFASGFIGYRFFEVYGLLEYRMVNMAPEEEARLMGLAYGSIILQGIPQPGDMVSFSVSQLPTMPQQNFSYTVQPTDNLIRISQGMANQILQNVTMLNNQFQATSPLGIGDFSQNTPQLANPNNANSGLLFGTPGFAVTNEQPFLVSNLNIVHAPGSSLGAFIEISGQLLEPVSTVDPTTTPPTTLNGYIPILNYLEGAVPAATQNLDTWQADVWYARKTELKERVALYNYFRRKMADFMGVPLNASAAGSGMVSNSRGSNSVRAVW